MPVYTVQLSDGRRVKVAGDREPSEADVLNAIGGQSESGGDLLGRMDDTVNSYEASLSPSEFLARHGAAAPAEPESAVGAIHEVGKSPIIPWSPPKATSDETPLGPPSAAFYNTFLKGSYDFLNTPYGAMSLGLGLGPMWMKRLAGLGFAEQMTEAASEKAGEYSVTHDPTTGYEALFSAAPVPLLAHPSVAFGENVALTKGDALEIGSRELLKDIEGATVTQLRPPETPWSHRAIGISPSQLGRTAMDALATPEAESAVDLAFRQMQPGYIKTPWEGEGTTAIRALQNDVSPVEPARLAERIGGGGEAPYGKVSYMREAEAPTAARTQEAIARDVPPTEPPAEPSGTPVENPPATPAGGSGVESVVEGLDFENIKRPHRVGVERGLSLAEADVPALEQMKKDAYAVAVEASANDEGAFKAAFGKGVYLEGVLEGAKRKGPNYEAYLKEQSPGEVPTTAPGTTETLPALDLISALERWKYPEDAQGRILNPQGQLFSLPHPDAIKAIGKGVWNNAIDVAIAAIKAGRAAGEAINSAIAYLKKQASGFDEGKIRENLSKLLELEAPQVAGDKSEMRKSASRATTSRMVPEPVQEKIAQAPESFYKVQPMKSVEETVAAMPDAELAAVPENSNIHVAAKLELSRRLFDAGKLDEGYEVFKQVSKTGTEFGQNINQFKFLKGQNPINVVHIVNRGLKESGRDPLTKDQAESLAKTSKASIDANKALDDAKDKWLKDPTDANAATADAAMKAANESDLATQREMAKFKVKTWPKMLKAFVQGNPLTPISQVANIVGNSLGAAMEAGSRGIAASLDAVRSMLTGGERKVAVQPFRGTAEAAKGFARGAAKGPSIMLRGSGDVVKGDTRAQLQPLRALAKAFAKNPDVPTVGGQVPFNERARLAVEGVFGIAPEVMLRMLAAADKPAYESGRARLIAEQSKLQNLSPDKARMAQRFPELFFDRESLDRINEEASAAVFQRKSKTVSYLENLIKDKGGDWGDLAFTLLVAPYRLTPWNLVGRTLIYNPLVAALRTGIDAAKGNTRGAEINSGRMIVGGMLYTAGYFLYKNGLIGPSLDSRDEQQKARLLSGEVLPPNHVNVDGLRRLVNGGDPSFKPGDETWDLTRGGGAAGAILSSVANIGRDFEKKPESSQEWLATLLKNSTLEQASFTINQSFLKGVTGILDAVRDRNLGPYINSVENMLLNVPTPNTLSTLSRATREYVPDLSADKLSDELSNVVRDRFGVAGLDDYLPLKRDLWGKPMRQTPEGRNALLYHLFDISKNKQVTDDPVALELYQVWRETSDPKAIPSLPMRNLTLNNQTYLLNPKQYERYAELTGQYRRQIVEALVTNPNWQNLDSENKIKVLDSAYDQGQQIGKALLLKESLGQLAEKSKPAGFRTK